MDFDLHKHHGLEWRHAPLPELILGSAIGVLVWELFYVRTVMPRMHQWAEKQPFYSNLIHRPGYFSRTGQDDITVLFVIAMHHMSSGSLLMLGSFLGVPVLFELGGLLELGFEIADTFALIRGVWPYEHSRTPFIIRVAFLMHHLPGLFLIVPVLHMGLYEDPHIRAVCAWLLFAGGVSALAGSYVHTRDFEKPREMRQAALAMLFSSLVFLYARFIVFPMGIYHYTKDLDEAGSFGRVPTVVRALAVPMMIFGLITVRINLMKLIKYSARALGYNVELYHTSTVQKAGDGKKVQ